MLTWKNAKRLVIFVIGGTILLIGLVGMLVPVMPGFIFIPIGLAILATEFIWAKRLLDRVKKQARAFSDNFTKKRPPDDPEARSS